MTRKRVLFLVLHVLAPVIAGGLIYVRWRDANLLMFRWFRVLRLETVVAWLRTGAAEPTGWSFWLAYSLPDGLWVYALTALMIFLWRDARSPMKFLWPCLGLLLGAGSELGQLAGIIPGSFDVIDLVVCLFAAGAAVVLTSRRFNARTLSYQGV
jgi:hypothetical protein